MRADQMFARGALSSKDPLSQDELRELRRRAYLEHGIAIIPLSMVRDPAVRDVIERECKRLHCARGIWR
jgi:hypothetical protein